MKKKICLPIIRLLVHFNRKIIETALRVDKKLVAKHNQLKKRRLER